MNDHHTHGEERPPQEPLRPESEAPDATRAAHDLQAEVTEIAAHGRDMGGHAHAADHEIAGHGQTTDRGQHSHAPAAVGEGHTAHAERHSAHTDHTGHELMFRNRFWVCLVLSIPVLLYSDMIRMALGPLAPPAFPGSQWVAPVLSVVIFAYGGVPFLRMAGDELRARKPGMMTLISLAITVAFVYSVANVFLALGDSFFWELVTLIDVMLLGHWLEMRSVRQASGALDELAKLLPDTAERLGPDGATSVVPAAELRPGDLLLVRPGAAVPADGAVAQGESRVDDSMITGESRPVDKAPGARVVAGTVNSGSGSLRVRVTAVGDETALSGIMRLVREAQGSRSRTQLLADRAAGFLFWAALAAAALTAVAWLVAVGFSNEVLLRVVTVLVIAFPHALGLAVPLVVAITTSLAARSGMLVRDRRALEEARLADVVLFDKTGTLTKGAHGVVGATAAGAVAAGGATGAGDDAAVRRAARVAAAVEGDSEHMIGRALRDYAATAGNAAALPAASGFAALKGRGVAATVDGRRVHVGGPALLDDLRPAVPEAVARFAAEAGGRGQTVVYLIEDGTATAAFAMADVVRPESRQAVDELRALGIEVAIISGDSADVVNAVAAELGVARTFAGVLPENKEAYVRQLQGEGKRVIMVGDGVNDAPALARADVGVAIGSGTDVAVESAGIILVRSNPLDVARLVRLSDASYRKMVQNIWWAAGYNVVAIPLAAGVLAPWGILPPPALGAALMSLSTIIVALNAQTLRRAAL